MEKQMSIFDFLDINDKNIPYGIRCRREGYTNVYDRLPDHDCKVAVIDHEGHRFTTRFYKNSLGSNVFDASKSRGYDICWWKEVDNE